MLGSVLFSCECHFTTVLKQKKKKKCRVLDVLSYCLTKTPYIRYALNYLCLYIELKQRKSHHCLTRKLLFHSVNSKLIKGALQGGYPKVRFHTEWFIQSHLVLDLSLSTTDLSPEITPLYWPHQN